MNNSITIGTIVPVIAALITAIASLIVASITFFSTKKNTREVSKNAQQLEILKGSLVEQQEENKAWRDYQYEARKHLYQQYEPLLFQLIERCENAKGRIYSLARTARQGDLGSSGWLSCEGYYMNSTIYYLLSPIVIIKLMQRSLTFVDLTVDQYINDQYLLAKQLYWSFTDDFDFARIPSIIDYAPNAAKASELQKSFPAKYCRQGLSVGRLDKAVEACITYDPNGVPRCMSFAEFEEAYMNPNLHNKFDAITELFLNFHPKTNPVFWRMLIAQMHIHKALISTRQIKLTTLDNKSKSKIVIKPLAEEVRLKLDWRHFPNEKEATDEEVLRQPFEVAITYLRKSFVQHLLC